MAKITDLPVAASIDGSADTFPIVTNNINTTQQISRNTFLNLSSAPVGLTDVQVLTNKTLTAPAVNNPVLGGTVTGTYTLGGTPTFPATVVTTTGSQVLTNKTLTSPTINSPTISNATISADAITGYTIANTGTVYGMSITTGTIGSSALAANSVTNSAIASNNLYTSKIYNPYKFLYYWNAGGVNYMATAGVQYVIPFDTQVYNTNVTFNTSTGTFTAPVTGYYYIYAQINANTNSQTTYINGYLYQNGVQLQLMPNGGYSGQYQPGVLASIMVSLSAGDTLQIKTQSGANNVSIQGGKSFTYFGGFLVSAT